MLTDDQKRELTIDTMASSAIEGMEPDRQTIENINSYIDGRMTRGEFIEESKVF